MEALEKVGMAELAHRQIGQLSGGQQQRVFLARALAQDARIYFMDEPFAGVDAATERAIIGVLAEMKARGRTVVVVHHDLQTVREYFDWLVLLNVRIIAQGPIEQVYTLENLRHTYGGQIRLLQGVPGAGGSGLKTGDSDPTGGGDAAAPGAAGTPAAAPER